MSLDKQRENQIKQHKENLEKRYQLQRELAPTKMQNQFDKENLEIQHKYDLEIFEMQAELTREINEKQSKLTKTSMWIVAVATFLASVMGAIVGAYLQRNWSQTTLQKTQAPPKITTQEQNISALPDHSEKEIKPTIKQSEPEVSSSNNSSKNVSPKSSP